MESSNQGTKDGTNPRQQILEKEAITKTAARSKTRKLIEIVEKKRIKRNCQVMKTLRNPREEEISLLVFQYIFIL